MRKIIYGSILSVTPDNGMVRVTVLRSIAESRDDRNMDVFTSPKSQYARKVAVALDRGTTMRLEVASATRCSDDRGTRSPCFQLKDMQEVA